jgi:hypothetical protein
MASYHIHPKTGTPGRCRVITGTCPYGGEFDHYASADEARAQFEYKMSGDILVSLSKTAITRNAYERLLDSSKLEAALLHSKLNHGQEFSEVEVTRLTSDGRLLKQSEWAMTVNPTMSYTIQKIVFAL